MPATGRQGSFVPPVAPDISTPTEAAVTFRKPSRTIKVEPIRDPAERERERAETEPSGEEAHRPAEPRHPSPTAPDSPDPARR